MARTAKDRFVLLGKSKFVHVVHTELYDKKNSHCQIVLKNTAAGKVPAGGMSPEAALALDGCASCGTHEVAKRLLPVEEKRAAAKEQRDDTISKMGDEKKPAIRPKAKVVKEKKVAPPRKTKSGVRSVAHGVEDGAKAKAEMLIGHGDEHGWKSTLTKDKETGHWVVTSKRGDETIYTFYIDGKYDVARHAYIEKGAWTGKLRGAHAVRRQMAMEGRDKPHPEPGKGRSGPRQRDTEDEEDETAEQVARRVPFSSDDEPIEIMDAIKGKIIRWRNNVSQKIEEAWVPTASKRMKIEKNPRTNRLMVSFPVCDAVTEHGETYGAERSVYIDQIVRVVGS